MDVAQRSQTLFRILPRSLIRSWVKEPIPGLSLSAGGLLALADLNTVAQRTALTGGSSWLDALVLAPGLHYQQAADELDRNFGPGWAAEPSAVESSRGGGGGGGGGREQEIGMDGDRYQVVNHATIYYLKSLCRHGGVTIMALDVTLDRGEHGLAARLGRLLTGRRKRTREGNSPSDMDWLSHLLYLASPLLTIAAIIFEVLLEDWWGLAFILALMLSRILNIWAIKQRTQPAVLAIPPPLKRHQQRPPPAPSANDRIAEWSIDLGPGRRVLLRGLASDLEAVTTQAWLRAKTTLDGYFEAASKLIVYLVATFSGNLSQAGAIAFMAMLIVSAALLGLSNAHATEFRTQGRLARPQANAVGSLEAGRADGREPGGRVESAQVP